MVDGAQRSSLERSWRGGKGGLDEFKEAPMEPFFPFGQRCRPAAPALRARLIRSDAAGLKTMNSAALRTFCTAPLGAEPVNRQLSRFSVNCC